jgi:hypothetical protein
MRRRLAYPVAIVGLLSIGAATLVPLPRQAAASGATPVWCLVCGEYGGVDVVINLLLFIPAGLGLGLLGRSVSNAALIGFAISLIVETLQLTVIPGRDASLSDLLTNTMGAAMGAAIGLRSALFLNPNPRQAVRLAFLAGSVWIGIQSGSALLLQPWVPTAPLRAAWARIRPGHPPFDGQVKSAWVSGAAVLHDSVPADRELRHRLNRRDIRLTLDLVSGKNPLDWSPLFELRAPQGSVLAVDGAGRDLAFQAPARSFDLRLRRPTLRLSGALPREAGRSFQVAAGEQGGVLWATWEVQNVRHRSSQALSPSLGWSLVIPFDYGYGPGVHLLTGLWVAGLLLPLGYWSGRSGRGGVGIAAALGALLATSLGLIPLLAGYPPVHWSEWLAGAAGLSAGWVSHRAAAYLGGRCDSPSTKEFY